MSKFDRFREYRNNHPFLSQHLPRPGRKGEADIPYDSWGWFISPHKYPEEFFEEIEKRKKEREEKVK